MESVGRVPVGGVRVGGWSWVVGLGSGLEHRHLSFKSISMKVT